ncbi:MAG: acyltransferase family protein, partial [Pseudomonadota bacterium]
LGPLPGAGTLLPVAGTMLCLAFPNRALPARFLCVGPVRYLGRISYALYLWHWPVLVLFLHYNNGRAPAAAEATGLLVLALMLASISYHLVEHPVRRAVHLAPGQRWALLGATFALLAVMIAAPLTSGTLGRPLPQAVALTGPTAAWSWQPRAETATDLPGYVAVGAPWSQAERRLVLWGDSHAGHYAPLLEALYAGQTPATAILLYDRHPPAGRSCPPTYGLPEDAPQGRSQRYREGCIADRARMLRYLARPGTRVDGVVLAISWNSRWRAMGSDREDRQGIARQQAALEKLLQELKALSVPVAVLGQVPQWTHDPMPCVAGQALELLRSDCAVELPAAALADDFERVHQGLAGLAGPGLTVLLPHRSLCATGRCLTTIADTFLYADRGHLRRDLTDPTRRALLDAMVLAPLRTWSAGLGADVTDLRDDSHRRRRDELTVERGVRIAHATQRELLTDP